MEKQTPVLDKNGNIKSFTVRLNGNSKFFRCDCGCNVFHKPDQNNLNRYKCNSCNAEYDTA